MEYKIVNYKAKINHYNETYLDLLSTDFNDNTEMKGSPLIVNKYYVARPDLISLAVYGDDSYGDIICKVNGISNPIELEEDTLIYIPEIEYIMGIVKSTDTSSDLVDNEETDEITKINIGFQKKKSEKRAPNEQTIGDKNYIIDKSLGLVFY